MAKSKNVVMIIASDKFRDEELQKPKSILEKEGHLVTIASSVINKEVTGMLGAKATPTMNFREINPKDWDAVVFVGGLGASEYWENPAAINIARKTVENKKILAAICIAPVTLANAGVLEGKKATVWSSEADKLTKKGVNYTGKRVEIDGKIITGNGPDAATEFGRAIADALK